VPAENEPRVKLMVEVKVAALPVPEVE
jgi:hypothetical protein